ncbi:hypothetical protein IRJ41_010841 [Triplophysa rosa]|uniref:Ig-like domain-containing protein n=1 Tax=Triplophysa rosa TaxID=992332 RepID=A0A9W7WNM6_TRIRA|nr:hypothetical protein IRJ41_010841 [Triplophysa rosa]
MGENGKPFNLWAKKIKQPGTCFCTVCHRRLQYGNNGKKVLARHQSEASHNAAVRALQYTSSLPGATSTTTEVHASMVDRVRICSFIAEHDLSFTVSQPLVNLMQSVVKDKSALSRLSISNAHASYLCTQGIAAHWKTELSTKLKTKMFSLNADEATDGNMDRILNVLVRYFDEDMGKVATQHLASRKMNIADALTITHSLTDILQSYSLNWNQVVGILLDNCNVMRGEKSGVETLVRRENPSLLDISGDTVHIVSNAAKALLKPFQGYVEQFCSDKEVFSEFQSLLHLENKSLIRPISSRFLQMLDVCNRIQKLMDPLIVHFYSVLSPHDQHKHSWLLNQLLDKHAVTSDEKARIILLQQQMAKSAMIGSLQDNPWVCDCRLASLLDISKAPESSMALLDRFLTCSGPPGLAGVPFQRVELSRCRRPYVVTSGTKITALLGSNVLLRCDATGHPIPTLMWFKSARPNHYNTGILVYTYVVHC